MRWSLPPPERTKKNKEWHRVPLPQMAIDIQGLPKFHNCLYVFTTTARRRDCSGRTTEKKLTRRWGLD